MCHFKAWLSLMKWNMFSFHGSSVVRWPCLKATGVEVERTQAQRINREVEMSETCLLYFCDFVVCDSLRSQIEHFLNHIVSILGPFWWKAENAVHGNHLADKHTLQKISSSCSSVGNSVWEIAHCILHCKRARNKVWAKVIHRQNVHQQVEYSKVADLRTGLVCTLCAYFWQQGFEASSKEYLHYLCAETYVSR